ncbi:MAG: hypothetical protein EXS17_07640 [Phycisphaerales bacterium]|nr:hypothetical protein [Phycisphaerales bacterium]
MRHPPRSFFIWIPTLSLAATALIASAQTAKPALAPTLVPAASPVAAPTDQLPSASDIFAKAVTAAGGADLIHMQPSRTQVGTIEMKAQSLKGTITTKSVSPNLLLIETDLPGFGKIRQGINGSVGWSIDPMRGPSLMDAEELGRVQRESSIESELNPALGCDAVEVVGLSDFRGAPCYKVLLKRGEGRSTRFYEIATGHLVGSVESVKSSMGEFEVTTSFSAFTLCSGRTIAKVQENTMMGQTQQLTMDSIEFAPIDPTVFVLPPEIQALAKAAQTPAPVPASAPSKSPATPPAKK